MIRRLPGSPGAGAPDPLGQKHDKPVAQQEVGFWKSIQKKFKRLVSSSKNKTPEQTVFKKATEGTKTELTVLKKPNAVIPNLQANKIKQDVNKPPVDSSKSAPLKLSEAVSPTSASSAPPIEMPAKIAAIQGAKGNQQELTEKEKNMIANVLRNGTSTYDPIVFIKELREAVAVLASTGKIVETRTTFDEKEKKLAMSIYEHFKKEGNVDDKKNAIYNYVLEILNKIGEEED